MKAPTCEAELLTRLKIFKLKFRHYITANGANLAIPGFIVPKVVLDDSNIADVRCGGIVLSMATMLNCLCQASCYARQVTWRIKW